MTPTISKIRTASLMRACVALVAAQALAADLADLASQPIRRAVSRALQPRKIITRGVIDMASSRVIEEDSFLYSGPMAFADDDDPTPAQIKAIDAALAKHFGKVRDALAEHEKQLTANGRITDELKSTIAQLNTDGAKLVVEEKQKREASDARILSLEQKLAASDEAFKALTNPQRSGKSIGEQFVESEAWKAVADQAKAGKRFRMEAVSVKNMISVPQSVGPGIFPQYLPTPVIPAFQPLTVRDLLGQGQTDSNTIIWVQEKVFTNAANYQGSDGNLKAQSDITYETETITAATIAHYVRVSKQALADFKVLMTLIDQRLRFGLKLKEERELLFGDGATNHLHGLVTQATAYATGLTRSGDQMLDILRHAMLQVQLAFYPATGICLSPTDWHNIELLKDSQERYLFANPQGVAPAMVWGLPVAQCYSFQGGEFLVGSFKLAATLFDREDMTVLISTEDQDNVIRNLVTVLCEERLLMGVSRPQAIIHGAFPSGATT